MSEQEPAVAFEFTIRDSADGQVALRQIAPGFQPIVLIEPVEEDGNITFKVDSTDLDYEGLQWLFEALGETLKKHLEAE